MFLLVKQQIKSQVQRPEKPRHKKRKNDEKNLMNIAARESIRISSLKPLYSPELLRTTTNFKQSVEPINEDRTNLESRPASHVLIEKNKFGLVSNSDEKPKIDSARLNFLALNTSNSNASESTNRAGTVSRVSTRNFNKRYSALESEVSKFPNQASEKDISENLSDGPIRGRDYGIDAADWRKMAFRKQERKNTFEYAHGDKSRELPLKSRILESKYVNLPAVHNNSSTEYGKFKLNGSEFIKKKPEKPFESPFRTNTFADNRSSTSLQDTRLSLNKQPALKNESTEYRQRNKISSSIYISQELIKIEQLRKVPQLHAKCWMLYDINLETILLSRKPRKPREIASLTKIMTCYLVLNLIKKFKLDTIDSRIVKVSKTATILGGTTARLQKGDKLSVKDLLYGMMLPSGNDAAFALSEYFGCLLYYNFLDEKKRRTEVDFFLPEQTYTREYEENIGNKDFSQHFVIEMNKLAREIGMKNTNFASPHGLANYMNKSTAEDLIRLCSLAVKNKEFIEIVSCQSYVGSAINKKNGLRELPWANTNKLLDKEGNFYGIKTGITPTAGPCLATAFKNDSHHFLLVILKTKNSDLRFTEAANLMSWTIKEFGKI